MKEELAWFALAYVGLGWCVIPVHNPTPNGCSCGDADCPSPGKHPRIRWQPFTLSSSTADAVRVWWGRWPTANVGVVTGEVSGVVVVDVDPRNGGTETLLDVTDDLPPTIETVTGGGGRHLWYALGAVDAPACSVLGPGLELKAEGGMVVVPPSIHASGRRYVWAPGREPWRMAPAPFPDVFLLAEVREPSRRERLERTSHEQADFAALWREIGIELAPGDNYYRCPFHDDHHPSLHVDSVGCRWFCFGCRRGGGPGQLRRMMGDTSTSRQTARLTGRVGRSRAVTLRGTRDVEVVGESRHQDELLQLTGGSRRYGGVEVVTVAELVPDPTNRFDPDAVQVFIDDVPVGYLQHDDARAYVALIEDSLDLHGFATSEAVIRGGWDRGRGEVGAFGVVLRLPESE